MATKVEPRLQLSHSENTLVKMILVPAGVTLLGYLLGFILIMGIAALGGQAISFNFPSITISVDRQADTALIPLLLLLANLIACFAAGLSLRRLEWLPKPQRVMYAALGAGIALALGILLFSFSYYLTSSESSTSFELFSSYNVARLVLGIAVAAFAAYASPPQLFLAGPVTLYIIWIIGPMIATAYIAFTNWDGVGEAKWVAFQNFDRLFNDSNFWTAINNNIKWLLFFLLIPTSMGLSMAMLFNSKFPGSRFFKIAFYSPLVLAGTVIGVIWEAMYRPDDGLINSFLHLIGIANTPGWLADRSLVLWCIIFAASWRQVGYVMILYLAGLKGLDVTLIEASTVDGASAWERFWYVIFPLLGPVTVVVTVISVIDSLRAFDLVAIMTRGGPANSSEVLANFMYIQAFNNYRMGYAGSIAVILMGMMLIFIVPYLIYTARTEIEY
jgi:multiple sugar transport system permease protein